MIRRGEVVRHSRDSRRSRRTLDELPREMRLGTNEEENTCSKGGVRTATTQARRDTASDGRRHATGYLRNATSAVLRIVVAIAQAVSDVVQSASECKLSQTGEGGFDGEANSKERQLTFR
jgi:hypothetical protein